MLATLENGSKKPFRIGLIGGSFAVPNRDHGNVWANNVTRWLNIILSASSCNNDAQNQNDTKLLKDITDVVCSNPKRDSHRGCVSKVSPNNATFCSSFKTSDEEGAYHLQYLHRSLDTICDNTILPKRPCTVFGGSGRYATLVSGAKGGTTSRFAKWTIQNLGTEPLDMFLWDHSINDRFNLGKHIEVYHGLLDQLIVHQPNISVIAFVYWQFPDYVKILDPKTDVPRDAKDICLSEHRSYFRNELGDLDYKYLPQIFPSKFKQALLMMSMNPFCLVLGCTVSDINDNGSSHPSDQGISMFSDLFIWQLLIPLQHILEKKCQDEKKPYHSFFSFVNTSEISDSNDSFQPWRIDNHWNPQGEFQYPGSISFLEHIDRFIHLPYEPFSIVTSLNYPTPIILDPLSTDMIALLCHPSNRTIHDMFFSNVLNDSTLKIRDGVFLDDPLKWVEVDIITILEAECAGFVHVGKRNSYRSDDMHTFSPLLTSDCIVYDCVPPSTWSQLTGKHVFKALITLIINYLVIDMSYPYNFYAELPMVKPVDFVFRVSVELSWKFICYLDCPPKLVYQLEESDDWIIHSMKQSNTYPRDLYSSCYANDQALRDKQLRHNFFYIIWSADTCYPWIEGKALHFSNSMMIFN